MYPDLPPFVTGFIINKCGTNNFTSVVAPGFLLLSVSKTEKVFDVSLSTSEVRVTLQRLAADEGTLTGLFK